MAEHRQLRDIAIEIYGDWGRKISPHALPYWRAMSHLGSMSEMYYFDTAEDVVSRFLCNAATWKGEVARRVKKELNGMLAELRETRK